MTLQSNMSAMEPSQQVRWEARFIKAAVKGSLMKKPKRPVRFRKVFSIRADNGADMLKKRLYVTSYGVYEVYLNGVRVGDHVLAPGWTTYEHRLHYQMFDVTQLIVSGLNVLAMEVGEGWYAGRLGWGEGKDAPYGTDLAVLAQLEVIDDSGTVLERIVSDSSWNWCLSAIMSSGLYDGETYDMREEQENWHDPNKTDGWKACDVLSSAPAGLLVVPRSPPARITQEITPVSLTTMPGSKVIVDFGQNLTGKIRIRNVRKPADSTITLRHAEILQEGELCTRPLRTAQATDTIISNGHEIIEWCPKYTFHGFRYVEIAGWSTAEEETPVTPDRITALVMHTDMKRTGQFSCSNPLVNKLHQNVVWSMRGNFLSLPTDCPQRDERLGWTGDIQVFAPAANFLFDTSGILSDWLQDLAQDQGDNDSIVPCVVPNILQGHQFSTKAQAVWGDAAILVPWNLYMSYGDVGILQRQYASMKSWLDVAIVRGPDGLWLDTHWQLGDWLDPFAPPDRPGLARTDGVLVADAYLVRVTRVMSTIASLVNQPADQHHYSMQSETLKTCFQNKYIAPSGRVIADTQTALALVLSHHLYRTPVQARVAATRLRVLVEMMDYRVSTGFAGTPLILHALSAWGHTDAAYRMLLEQSCPSWLYPVTMGATTIWERWDSLLPDGTVNPGQMTSFNHYALGSVVDWLHCTVGGISPTKPGWEEILVRPIPGGNITSAEVTFENVFGTIHCVWNVKGGEHFAMRLVVPPQTRARVVLPIVRSVSDGDGIEGQVVGPGSHEFSCNCGEVVKWPPAKLDNSWIRHSS